VTAIVTDSQQKAAVSTYSHHAQLQALRRENEHGTRFQELVTKQQQVVNPKHAQAAAAVKQKTKQQTMIKKIKSIATALLVVGFLTLAEHAVAGDTATQTVTFAVSAINELSVSGNPGSLIVSTATAGTAPDVVTDSTTSYAITTNETGRKITGAIDTPMPSGVTLAVNLAAPTGASSAGLTTLGTSAMDLVTGISTLNDSSKSITYSLSATSAAGVVPSASKTVTLTITAGS
jgi:hypothetical protein